MNKKYWLYYILMIFLNLLPMIPLSIKGILGLICIVISCVGLSYKDGMFTATLWVVLGFANFISEVHVDYEHGMVAMILGTALYYSTAYYLGISIDQLKYRNGELEGEIQRRKDTERELREKMMLIQRLIDTIPSPVFFKSLDQRYIRCNKAFESSIGIEEKDLIGKNAYDIFTTEGAEIYHRMDEDLLEESEVQVYETVARFAGESMKNVIINKALLKDELGNPIGIVGVMTDITHKKETERLKQRVAENKLVIEKMMDYDKLKTEFFSNISHDLRTPVNVMLGSIQLMEMCAKENQYDDHGKIVRNISRLKQNGYRLLRLVNNLIDITKIDACAFEIHLKNDDIVSIVEEITLSVSEYIEHEGIALIFDTEMEEKIITCDDEKIERIMLNLLSNAVKFTPAGGCIWVNVYEKGDHLCISVRDNGIGISKDKQQEIFKRFFQVNDGFIRNQQGSGIGLNLVKSLVEMHGGTIDMESEFGKGTTFVISLPSRKIAGANYPSRSLENLDHGEKIHIEFSDIYSAGYGVWRTVNGFKQGE